MRMGALGCAVGAYCALAGALLLVAPHRLVGLPSMLLESGWPWWGLAFLLSGTVLLTGMVLPPPRVVTFAAHACAIGLADGSTARKYGGPAWGWRSASGWCS